MSEPFDPVSTLMENRAYNLEKSEEEEEREIEGKDVPEEFVTKCCSEPPKSESTVEPEYIPFWSENPNVIFNPVFLFEFFPAETMTFNQKLNAITRTVLIMTVLSYIYTNNTRVITISVITIVCIFLLHYSNNQTEKFTQMYDRHGPIVDVKGNPETAFSKPSAENPLSNVLLTDYDYNVNKRPAPPSFTPTGRKTIVEETKNTIQKLNPDQPNIDKRLFNDVTSNLELEQSMRQFYSTANTTIPNDQGGFAEFCYGDMISGKEGNESALTRHNPRYMNY